MESKARALRRVKQHFHQVGNNNALSGSSRSVRERLDREGRDRVQVRVRDNNSVGYQGFGPA